MRKRVKHIRDGLALVLVLAAIALAAVLGFAMLSGAALQTRTTSNAANSAAADYLGESGINIAMYYLQYPEQAPSLNGSGYWAGTGGDLAVGSGWVNVTVTRDASNNYTYEIVSIGKMGNSLTQITRTKQARVYVRYEYKLKYATGVNGSTNFYTNTSISGDVLCNGDVTVQKTVTITGSCYCKTGTTVALGTAPAGGYKSVPTGAIGAPTNADVNMYTTYMVGQTTYNCDYFPAGTSALTGTQGVTTKTSSNSNPAGIWYCDGNLTLNDYVTIDGTLVVKGNLIIAGKGIVLSPKTNYPGLIVTGNMQVNQSKKVITVNGVCYVGAKMKSSGVPLLPTDSSTFTVNGGLLIKDSFESGYNVTTTVKLDSTMSKAPDLSSVGRWNTGVTILRWGSVVAAPY